MEINEENSRQAPLILRTDVTALKLCGEFILAGIGSWIHIYRKDTGNFILKLQVLNGQKIYGFRTSENSTQILVFGGKQFTVVLIDCIDFKGVTRLIEPIICDDWLHDGVWLQKNEVALLTAHNMVQLWNMARQTLLKSYRSEDNSILYSGLLQPLQDDILVLAGTVFSEVIVHCCKGDQPMHRLTGHQGVIFSIACDLDKGLIVTTSDDRSVRLWKCQNTADNPSQPNTTAYWQNATITLQHTLYGHTARVMRSSITSDMVVSVGEDSAICYWTLNGKLLKTITSHQGAPIWSLDVDNTHLVTGGGDNAVILHPLTVASQYGTYEDIEEHAKKISFTARRNIVILYEDHELAYYDMEAKRLTSKFELNFETTFVLMSVSSCKQLVAVADMNGNLQIYAEICKGESGLLKLLETKLGIGKIMSMQWAGNRHLVMCDGHGKVTVLASKGKEVETLTTFQLPPSKEAWLTASGLSPNNKTFVLGARNGHIHIFVTGQSNPVKTFHKVHGNYGPQMVVVKSNEIISTGRDGSIKRFMIRDDTRVSFMNSTQLPFVWVEKFLDAKESIICGFRERDFVVFRLDSKSTLVEVQCGGGHRSWDAVRYFEKIDDTHEELITLMYLKNSSKHQSSSMRCIHVATFRLSRIESKNIILGSHCKEINCLKSLKSALDQSTTFYISGGEDTTLRISSCKESEFGTVFRDELVFRHLSSIRTLKTLTLDASKTMIITAGGRAQICIKVIELDKSNDGIKALAEELTDYQIKGTDKERKGNQTWRECSVDFDPETRVMDVDVIDTNGSEYTIVAGCSDAYLRIFNFYYHPTGNSVLRLIGENKYHTTCILKTHNFKFRSKNVLITATTRGEVAFWDFSEELKEPSDVTEKTPFFLTKTNKSGINSLATQVTEEDEIILATGGDDNSIKVTVLSINMENLAVIISSQITVDNFHCSQITGLELLLDSYLISTSIDQRVMLAKYRRKSGVITVSLVEQSYSDVADIQGVHVVEDTRSSVTICVYGKGVQVIKMPKQADNTTNDKNKSQSSFSRVREKTMNVRIAK